MQGTVLFYDPVQDSGLIRGADDNRYYFTKTDCFNNVIPQAGQSINFVPENNLARQIVSVISENTFKIPASSDAPPSTPQVPAPAAKTIYNYPGVLVSVLLLISLFIPYGNLANTNVSVPDVVEQTVQFKLVSGDLGVLLVIAALALTVIFALGLNWQWLLWTYMAFAGLFIISFLNEESLFSVVSNMQTAMRTSSEIINPSLTVPTPSVFDFLTFGFYFGVVILLAQGYLVLVHRYEIRQGAFTLPAQLSNPETFKVAVKSLKTTVAGLKLSTLKLSTERFRFRQATEKLGSMMGDAEQKHALFFGFIHPYLRFIDSGEFFRKPFYWLYVLNAMISLLIPLLILYAGLSNNIFGMPFKFTFAFLLVFAIASLAAWVNFQLWWERKDKVEGSAKSTDEFVATPVFSHFVQTMGESYGTMVAIIGTGAALIGTIFLGENADNLGRSMGLGFLTGGSFALIFVWPVVGFFVIISSRVLAEMIRALISIANNLKKLSDSE
ncbi:hypothetical protein DYBT9275_04459 [Dyadobacter sp. CECT 9275]|uniref:Uncharacterized protein n=1 Tax=Dyadobacter helix TaxID=2822344 RepID=A0A916N6C5_9BACT|nr:hypothetical protein [Dyadobacter sp. CECT 9275]CAG5009271.1 hypothetical protein DYBT9275_04459 [Dyadobacter sp. CECT 9275]